MLCGEAVCDYPEGSCGSNGWSKDQDGIEKCGDMYPHEGDGSWFDGIRHLYDTMGDSKEVCCTRMTKARAAAWPKDSCGSNGWGKDEYPERCYEAGREPHESDEDVVHYTYGNDAEKCCRPAGDYGSSLTNPGSCTQERYVNN
jgi:hypothetical protein